MLLMKEVFQQEELKRNFNGEEKLSELDWKMLNLTRKSEQFGSWFTDSETYLACFCELK